MALFDTCLSEPVVISIYAPVPVCWMDCSAC